VCEDIAKNRLFVKSKIPDFERGMMPYTLSLKADIICEGHFGVFKGKQKVVEFIRSYITG